MDGYKDFQGKTLDDAIREATAYFDVVREKLEIDIIQDAKSGVFGLIGARKAKVRARRVQLKTTVDDLVGRGRDLRASFREEFERDTPLGGGADTDSFAYSSKDIRRDEGRLEDNRRDESGRDENRRDESRREDNRERSSRRPRNDRARHERDETSRLDEGFSRGEDDRAGERSNGQEERKTNNRRQRNERSNQDRSEKNQERNSDRPRRNDRNRSDRNQDRNQERSDRPQQDRGQYERPERQPRQNTAPIEGSQEPLEDENTMLTDAESRERSSRRRRRGRGRSRSRTDANGTELSYDESNGMDATLEGTNDLGDAQDSVDFEEASQNVASDFDAPSYEGRRPSRRDSEGRRDEGRRDDNRRTGDRRDNGNRRDADRRDADRRDNDNRREDSRRGDSRRQGENRRSNYDRRDRSERSDRDDRNERNGDRPYRNAQGYEAQVDDFDQNEALFEDQAYDRPEGLPDISLESLDQDLVRSVALEVTERLVTPIIGPAALTVEATDGRVKVGIDCGENSGLLIGREGQTLASIQYLASRIIARKLGAAVRVQLDTGDYRERQDEKLRELALSFADRVRATGRPQSTRPLSSYHRRVVHLALQDDEEIVTRSKGEGPLKRVIILRRRKNNAE